MGDRSSSSCRALEDTSDTDAQVASVKMWAIFAELDTVEHDQILRPFQTWTMKGAMSGAYRPLSITWA